MAEAISGPDKLTSRSRMRLSKRLLIILTLTLAIPVVWFSVFRSAAQSPVTCEAQYDTLVKQAKTELTAGDRTAAINSLIAARNKLRDCETPTAKDVAPIFRN
jgi:hypothetical protein